jgi:hypothetical protein
MPERTALRLILEAGIYLGLLLFLVQQKPLMSIPQAVRPPSKVFLVALVVVMLGAQLLDRGMGTFPFPSLPPVRSAA